MLSIRFGDDREWWTSGTVFDRLFQSALDGGQLAPEMEVWRHVVDVNAGLGFDVLEPSVADDLITALRTAARRELASLEDTDPGSPDSVYRASLIKLLTVLRPGAN